MRAREQSIQPVLEQVDCAVCGNIESGHVAFTSQEFSIVKCPTCGVLRVNPRLTMQALQQYYDGHYWVSENSVVRGYFNYFGDASNIQRTFRRRLAKLLPYVKQPGRLLDVGCASGYLVQLALEKGWDAFGIEWSDAAVAQALPAVRKRITRGTLATAKQKKEQYDLITFWDYLEHSPDPVGDCEKAVALLKPGGWLSIIIPDAGSWLARWMGPRWEEYRKPQEHLYFFTAIQLIRLLSSLGMHVLHQGWEGKYASLDFAFSRFTHEDGWMYTLAQTALWGAKALGCAQWVVYVNPHDKVHIIGQKELA